MHLNLNKILYTKFSTISNIKEREDTAIHVHHQNYFYHHYENQHQETHQCTE